MPNIQKKFKIKSIPSLTSINKVEAKLDELGFLITSEATTISDNKYWNRRLFYNGQETIAISDELGNVTHLKDPIVTICGKKKTIEALRTIL
tara:strand:+ start:2055 stop:2330 length:276 start_codon:yes stop_codon:yes gene_type:complete